MADIPEFTFTTGTVSLPDIGELSYNGVTFSSLYHTRMRSRAVKDNANWTVKYVEYVLEASGVVTLTGGAFGTTDAAMLKLREQLDQSGGVFSYTGRGFGNFLVNAPGSPLRDVAWGPMPETLEFQPLGGGLGAYVTWRCTVRVSEYGLAQAKGLSTLVYVEGEGFKNINPQGNQPVLQFNFDYSLDYDEENYVKIALRGTLEIPLTRNAVNDATVPNSVDAFRQRFMSQLINGIDQERYRITSRRFPISRDRRTMEFEVTAEEIAPMGDPPGAANARGRFTVRPVHKGQKTPAVIGFVLWTCSLSITYTIRKDKSRRLAYLAFMYMVWYRMRYSALGATVLPGVPIPQNQFPVIKPPPQQAFNPARFNDDPVTFYDNLFRNAKGPKEVSANLALPQFSKAMLIDFGIDEGVHHDSKTVTFEASWWLLTSFPFLLQACGLWHADKNAVGGPIWALSMADVTGWRSWDMNVFRPQQDVIVDLRIR